MSLKKILIAVVAVVALAGIVALTIVRSQSGYTKVVTATVAKQDLVSVVSGTGQIKPKTYVNVGVTAFGRITHLYVKEGDHVKKGQILATVEDVQATSNVDAQKATISSAKTDISSYIAAETVAEANVEHAKADLEQKKLDYDRARGLYEAKLISKQDFDSKKAAYDLDVATLAQNVAAVAQAKAQTESARGKLGTAVATLRSNYDLLNKTVSAAPFDGLVTNVPVREGETVVTGIQNAEGSTLMTLADMSVITAEVKVDETDIVNVKIGQTADVSVDALPGKVFKGHITNVGDQAINRSTGVATSQSTTGTEEAKDFKVVVTLDNPSDEMRPGLSATAKITTAESKDTLAIPIQALTLRDPAETNQSKVVKVDVALSKKPKSAPVQGVFVVQTQDKKARAIFRPVQTGITGATDIQVISGLQPGEQIVTGTYKVLRFLKSGTPVKVDNTPPAAAKADDDSSS